MPNYLVVGNNRNIVRCSAVPDELLLAPFECLAQLKLGRRRREPYRRGSTGEQAGEQGGLRLHDLQAGRGSPASVQTPPGQ